MGAEQVDVINDFVTELEPYLDKFDWENPDRWRVEELAVMGMEMHSFLNCELKGKIPRQVLGQLKQARQGISREVYTAPLLKQMIHQLRAKELRLYQLILPPGTYSAITRHLPTRFLEKPSGNILGKLCLKKCREAFQKLPDWDQRLKTPIGSELLGGRKTKDLQSVKKWPLWGAYIQNFYELFHLFAPVTGRGWNKMIAKSEKGRYPLGLRTKILEFFQAEFPGVFDKLSLANVTSRIQYGEKRRVQRQFFPPQERRQGGPK